MAIIPWAQLNPHAKRDALSEPTDLTLKIGKRFSDTMPILSYT